MTFGFLSITLCVDWSHLLTPTISRKCWFCMWIIKCRRCNIWIIDITLIKLVFCGQLNRLFKTGYLLFWWLCAGFLCLIFETSSIKCTLPTFIWEKDNIYECGVTTSVSWFEVHVELMSLLLAIILPTTWFGEVWLNSFPHFTVEFFTIAIVAEAMKVNRL